MKRLIIPACVTVLGILSALFFAYRFPAVEGLGTKVRLPVYHGALTWATLIAFGFLLLLALWYLLSHKEAAWRWTSALRWSTVLMWTIGTVLGFAAAYNTWDFSASQTPILKIMSEDPRLVIQVVIMCLGLIMLVLPLVLESRRLRAAFDIVFVIGSWLLLVWAMRAGDALHPDSPVMSSDEIFIKVVFFLIVAGHAITFVGLTSLLALAPIGGEKLFSQTE
ncbi:MAG: hypothetical protein FWE87_02065 [Coriobacteriia bacterium]|nr:hypothetical protein [Coriobacteriia bacterium]